MKKFELLALQEAIRGYQKAVEHLEDIEDYERLETFDDNRLRAESELIDHVIQNTTMKDHYERMTVENKRIFKGSKWDQLVDVGLRL